MQKTLLAALGAFFVLAATIAADSLSPDPAKVVDTLRASTLGHLVAIIGAFGLALLGCAAASPNAHHSASVEASVEANDFEPSCALQRKTLHASLLGDAISIIRAALTVFPSHPSYALRIVLYGRTLRVLIRDFLERTLLDGVVDGIVDDRRVRVALARALVSFGSLHLVRVMSVSDILLVVEELERSRFLDELCYAPDTAISAIAEQYLKNTLECGRAKATETFVAFLRDSPSLREEFDGCLHRAFKRIGRSFSSEISPCSTVGRDEHGQPCWDAFGLQLDAATPRKAGLRRKKGKRAGPKAQ